MSDFTLPATVFEFSRDNDWLAELKIAPVTRPISFAPYPWLAEPDNKSEVEGR
jgi:hypothetical protein